LTDELSRYFGINEVLHNLYKPRIIRIVKYKRVLLALRVAWWKKEVLET
jgi:hypothetical protein